MSPFRFATVLGRSGADFLIGNGENVGEHPLVMTRETEAALLDFCAAQFWRFDAPQWIEFPHPDRAELAAAALFLVGGDWYGHRSELLDAAERLCPGSSGQLSVLVQRTGFDLSRFSNLLRRRIEHEPVPS